MTAIAGLMTWFGISVVGLMNLIRAICTNATSFMTDLPQVPRWLDQTEHGPQQIAL